MAYLIPQKGKKLNKNNILMQLISGVSSYICIVPLVLVDLFIIQFQFIYFGLNDIPKLQRKEFFSIDRHLLKRLNFLQKVNCLYCEYANGVVAYAKAVTNQMEIYSCAIKHLRQPAGHEHQKKFYDRKRFS